MNSLVVLHDATPDLIRLNTLISSLPSKIKDYGNDCVECFQKLYQKKDVQDIIFLSQGLRFEERDIDFQEDREKKKTDIIINMYILLMQMIALNCTQACGNSLFKPFYDIFSNFQQYLEKVRITNHLEYEEPYEEFHEEEETIEYDPVFILQNLRTPNIETTTTRIATKKAEEMVRNRNQSFQNTVFVFLMLLSYVIMVIARIITPDDTLGEIVQIKEIKEPIKEISSGDEFKQVTIHMGKFLDPMYEIRRKHIMDQRALQRLEKERLPWYVQYLPKPIAPFNQYNEFSPLP